MQPRTMSHRLVDLDPSEPYPLEVNASIEVKPSDIRRAAMDLLARREHSQLELLTKLQNRFRKRFQADRLHRARDSALDSALDSASDAPTSVAVVEPTRGVIQVQIDRLTDEGLQSDFRLAGSVIRARSYRGHGPVKIGGELRQKGVNDTVIFDAFLEENIDWFEKVREVSHRKFGPDLPVDSAEKAKRGRFLQQRGFSWDQIQSI